MEAEAARETNGCGTEWRSGSEDVGDTVGVGGRYDPGGEDGKAAL